MNEVLSLKNSAELFCKKKRGSPLLSSYWIFAIGYRRIVLQWPNKAWDNGRENFRHLFVFNGCIDRLVKEVFRIHFVEHVCIMCELWVNRVFYQLVVVGMQFGRTILHTLPFWNQESRLLRMGLCFPSSQTVVKVWDQFREWFGLGGYSLIKPPFTLGLS